MLIARQTHRGEGPLGLSFAAGWGRAAAVVAVSLMVVSAVRADIQLPAKGRTKGERQVQKAPQPPLPVASKVRVEVGARLEITLRATGGLGRSVDFILRSAPTHGVFEGESRRIDRDSIAVTYVHRARDGAGRDEFSFAAQATGTPVSASGTVEIEIIDVAPSPPPAAAGPDVAAAPAALDFGAVESGRSTGATLTLENRGASTARGRLDPPLPWTVDGNPAFEIAGGSRQSFRLVFRPTVEGAVSETLRIAPDAFGSAAGCVVQLIGTGLAGKPRLTPTPEPILAVAPGLTPAATVVPQPVAALPTPTPATATSDTHSLPSLNDPPPVVTNEARVLFVNTHKVTSSTIELAWKPPVPLPRSYRVERRSFAWDDNAPGGVRTDWLPYARTDFRVRADEVVAELRGFGPGELITLRVLSVDGAGQLSEPSPPVDVLTHPGATWWHPTPLKGLFLALALCLGLLARRRWQTLRLLEELDARRTKEADNSFEYAPKG